MKIHIPFINRVIHKSPEEGYFNDEGYQQVYKKSPFEGYRGGSNIRHKSDFERISPLILQKLFIRDSTVASAILSSLERIILSDPYIEGGKPTYRKLVEKFFEENDLKAFISEYIQYKMMYGGVAVDLFYGDKSNRLVRAKPRSPIGIDYKRDKSGRVIRDDYSKEPVGLVYEVDKSDDGAFEMTNYYGKFSTYKIVGYHNGDTHLPYIIYSPFYTVDSREPIGVGVIEMAYNPAVMKSNLLLIHHDSAGRNIGGVDVITVGDPEVFPNPRSDDLKRALRLAQVGRQNRLVALEYYNKFNHIDIDVSGYVDAIKAFRDEEITGLRTPKAVATGVAEDVNRDTLNTQIKVWGGSMKVAREIHISSRLKEELFTIILYSNGIRNFNRKDLPELVWEKYDQEERRQIVNELSTCVSTGLLTPTLDVENRIRKLYGLKELDEDTIGGGVIQRPRGRPDSVDKEDVKEVEHLKEKYKDTLKVER